MVTNDRPVPVVWSSIGVLKALSNLDGTVSSCTIAPSHIAHYYFGFVRKQTPDL
jgi:hypothetical protein